MGEDRPELAGPPSGRSICVYLGGNLGREQRYIDEAGALGRLMAAEGIGLVYGGASVGLMGVVANAVLEGGGFVIGVIPRQLSYQELAHEGLSQLLEVATMHERKHLMQQLSQGCIALPGGFGTLEEIFEALCWSQRPLELHEKPCCFANIDGYYGPPVRLPRSCDRRGAAAAAEPRARPAGPDRHGSATDDSDGVGRRRTGHA